MSHPPTTAITLESHGMTLWQGLKPAQRSQYTLLHHSEGCFLMLLDGDALSTVQAHATRELIEGALLEDTVLSAYPLNGLSLWLLAAQATCSAPCHVYINMDLLTIDPHAQDWGDFKIKPEQVEVQRNERTLEALFAPRKGFVLQVVKNTLPALMDKLRSGDLAQHATVIGKSWGNCAAGTAQLDVYRDAKKQLSVAATAFLLPQS
jgi:hypothetical protein